MTFRVVPATQEHALLITLRKSDDQEAREWLPGVAPAIALRASISVSTEAYTAFDGDAVVAIFGVSVHEHEVHPWLMCSDLIGQHSKPFLRIARNEIQSLIRQHPGKLVGNYVYTENLRAKRLLVFLGFRWVNPPGTGKFAFFYHPQSCASQP